jgi:hypothetical protein
VKRALSWRGKAIPGSYQLDSNIMTIGPATGPGETTINLSLALHDVLYIADEQLADVA